MRLVDWVDVLDTNLVLFINCFLSNVLRMLGFEVSIERGMKMPSFFFFSMIFYVLFSLMKLNESLDLFSIFSLFFEF